MTDELVVVGDLLLDVDLDGRVERLVPDAPVPVVDDAIRTSRVGGAGLAATLLALDGRDVVLVTAIGDDDAGVEARELLAATGVRVVAGRAEGGTPVKTRVRVDGRPLLRLDTGRGAPAPMPDGLDPVIGGAGVVLVSDYGRAVADDPRVRDALVAGNAQVVWDPHPRGPAPVHGVTVVTPNCSELFARIPSQRGAIRRALPEIVRAGEALCLAWSADAVAVTMAADGAVLVRPGVLPVVAPTSGVTGADACGAGDRFAGAVAAALADGAVLPDAVTCGVAAASRFVHAGGVAGLRPPAPRDAPRPTTADSVIAAVRAGGGTVVATSGCFDLLHAGHVASLRAARELGDCLVVCLNSDDSARSLKGPTRPVVSQGDRAAVLAGLGCVDAVEIFDEPTPEALLMRLRPDVFVKGGDYRVEELPEAALLAGWGGQAVVVPYLEGRSTTRLVKEMGSDA
ncbi:MAG: rfaE2 [Actinomycetia bacterium]|nr:rfaE2 [Actinomycetes bacterium]